MKVNNTKVAETTVRPQEIEKPNEYRADLIKLFNFFDSVDDDVLNIDDTKVRLLEDILNGKVNANYSFDDMAKYVIIRNLANGESLTLENIVENYDEIFEICKNDSDSMELIEEIKNLFNEYDISQTEIMNMKSSDNIITKDKEIYEKDADLSKIADDINEIGRIANKVDIQSRKNQINAEFLNKFSKLYNDLSQRINFLRQKSEFKTIVNKQRVFNYGLSSDENPTLNSEVKSNNVNWGL